MVALMIGVALGCTLGMGAGFVGGHGYARRHLRYANPQLHEGRWDVFRILNGNVTWARQGSHSSSDIAVLHLEGEHEAVVCTITRSMSHVDECACGKKRYGVFGSWS